MTQDEMAADIRWQIRMLLVTHNMTQGQLADRMGQGQPSVSMMLARGTYTLATLIAVANAFGEPLTIRIGAAQ